ncbi:MAG: murein biosynthesis integral membrane protein MurJ [Candidatus Andersenbacteria bacterium]
MSEENKQTLGSASLIGITAFGGALVGFVLQLLVAYYFGASASTDAFFMAASTSELLGKLLLGGSITAVFLPLFVQRLSTGQKTAAWNLALNILHVFAALFLVLIITVALFTPAFVRFIAPGFSPATAALTTTLLRVLLPSFLFLFLVDIAVAMLHALKQFALPATLRLIAPTISIMTIVVLGKMIGIYALALGALIGSGVQLIYVAWALRRQGFIYRPIFQPFNTDIKKLLYLVYPFIFSMIATQAAGIVYRILVSDLSPGSLSALKYAEKITQLCTIIFLNSVTIVIYPLLSEKASHADTNGMRTTIASAIRLTTFITIPLIVGIVVLREPLIAFIYQRGSFDTEAALLTSTALLFLILGFTVNAASSILGHAVLALQQTRAAVAVTVASHAVAIMLFITLVPRLAHAGLALASSLVPLSSCLLYFLYLHRRIPHLQQIFWQGIYIKIVVLAGLLFIVLQGMLALSMAFPIPVGVNVLLQLVVPTIVGSLVFFGGAYLWRIPEMHDVVSILHKKLRGLRP